MQNSPSNPQEPSDPELYRQLSRLINPAALCEEVGKKTKWGKVCDHTFKHAKAFATRGNSIGEWNQIQDLLEALGAFCDCEVGFNIGTRLEELEPEEEEGEEE